MSGCQFLRQRASAGEAAAWMHDLRLESEMVKSISAAPGNLKALRKPPGAKLPQCEVTQFINLLTFPGQKSVSWVLGYRFLPKKMHMPSLVH